jgi:hypothetical protein
MENYSPKEIIIVEEFVEALNEDTELAIRFLIDCLLLEEDEINEMGSSEIFELVDSEIEDIDFETLKRRTKGFDIDNFDLNKFNHELKKPCKNPCSTCPYTKNSLTGYFGGQDANEYADAIHRDTVIACHTRTKHNKETHLPDSDSDVTICTGHIVSQIKVLKRTRHPDGMTAHGLIREQKNFEELKENALGFDFKKHHNID